MLLSGHGLIAQAIQFVGASSNTSNTSNSLSLTKPVSTAAGDLILIQVGYTVNSDNIVNLAGFNALVPNNTAQGNLELQMFWKIADGTEGASFTITASANTKNWVGSIVVYRNVDPISPFEGLAETRLNMATSANTFVAPSVTAVSSTGRLVNLMMARHTGTPTSITAAGSMTSRTTSVAANRMILVADEALTASGATGTRTATFAPVQGGTGVNTAAFAVAVVLRRAENALPISETIQFLGAGSNSGASASISINKPSGVEIGDLILIQAGHAANNNDITAPAGFTTLYNTVQGALTGGVFYRFADGSEGASFTMALGASRNWLASIAVYRNVNPYSVFEASPMTQANMDNVTTFNAPTATAVNDEGVLVTMTLGRHNTTPVFLIGGNQNQRASAVALSRMILLQDQQLTATGATGTRTLNFFPAQGVTGNNTAFFATNIILRPHIKMYSYQSGDWGTLDSWTRDPSGTTLVKRRIPVQFDEMTVLNGRTITRSTNTIDISKTTLQAGGFLNLGSTTGHSLGNVSGGGRLQLSSVTFPGGTFTDFVSALGGTVEYFNIGGTLPTGVGTYNNVILRNSTGGNITYTQASNIVMNGSLTLTRTGAGTLTLQHGDNATARSLTIGNGATVGAGTSWTVFNGNQQGHTVSINGNLINSGTVRFTNQGAPDYTTATTTGAILLTMTGGQDNDLTANGVTDLYQLILNKGIDRTFVLSVTASSTSNFRLFGPNNTAESGLPPNINDNRALNLLTGTIRLGTNIVIPSLVSGAGQGYRIDEDVMLWLDGANVTTSSGPTFNNPASLVPYGAFRVSGSSVFTDNSTQGIVTREKAVVLIEGGTITTVCIRTSFSAGTQRGAFTMTGGTLTIDGTLPAGFGSSMALYAPFFLPYPDNTFEMSGGTINILNSNPLTGQSGENFSMVIGALPDNINVTGGTINITVPTTRPAFVNTSAPFWNLNVTSSASTHSMQPRLYLRTDDASYGVNAQPTVPFTLPASDIIVRNNLELQSSAVMTSGLDIKNVTVGRNFNIGASATYTPSTNTTSFNGSGAQLFTLNGTITSGLNNLTIAKSADTLKLGGSASNLLVLNQFDLTSGVFADQGKTVEIRGNMTVSGIHTGSGKLSLTTATSRTIGGTGSGVIGNIDLSGPAAGVTATVGAALRINGTLTFVANGANNRLLDIGSNALTLGPVATVVGPSGPSAPIRMIKTNGLQSAGGVSKIYNGLSFTFPIGAGAANRYTPSTISFDVAPSVYGTITIRPVVNEHPNVTALGRSLTQYWRTTSSGFTLGSAKVTHAYTYVDASVVTGSGITEDGYVPARYNSNTSVWVTGSAAQVDETTNVATFSGPTFETTIDGEYTAGDNSPVDPFGTVSIYYSYTTSGAWNNVNTWSLDGHTGLQNIPATAPGVNSVVRVGNNHTVNVTANNALAGSLLIQNGSTVDLGNTTGHNFGAMLGEQVSGNGTLRIASSSATAEFPAGDFSEFIGPNGGIVEYYRTGTNFTIPTVSAAPSSLALTNYRNLVVNVASATGTITLPSQNLTIFEDLTVKGTSGTDVIMANTVAGNLSIGRDLLIQSSALRMQYNTANSRSVTVSRNIQIDSGATFGTLNSTTDVTHALTVNGSVTNNGTYNLFLTTARHTTLTFLGAANASFTGSNGSASTTIFRMTVNKGTTSNSILTFDVAGTVTFQSSNNWLTLINGMFRLARASTITLSNTAVTYTLLGSTGISVSNASAVINISNVDSDVADLLLGGKLEILNGTINIGNTNNFNQDIEYASSGLPEIVIENGALNVNGQIRRIVASSVGSLVWRQSGGTVTIRGRNQVTNNGMFEIANTGSVFEMTGGVLQILRGGSLTYSDAYIRPGSTTVTGGIIRFAPLSAIGAQAYTVDATSALWNVEVTAFDGTNTAALTIQVNPLTIRNNLTLANSSTLNTGNFNLTIGGTFLKNSTGVFNRGTQTTTFNGTSSTINGTFTTQSFLNLTVAANSNLTLAASSPVIVANNLTINSGATLVDGGNLLRARAGITNNGTHSSASNSSAFGIELDGSATQTITGKGTFGNLIINNSNNVALGDSITVNRRLTLTLGVLDMGEHKLTLGTAAEVTGSFSSARMLRSNGVLSDGGVQKNYSGTGSFTYPIGVFGKYTPATINVTATSSAGSITVKVINAKHPATRDAAEKQLNYYWNVKRSGFSSFTATHTYNYMQGDVTGAEGSYLIGRYVFPNWTPIGGVVTGASINTSTNVMTLTGVNYINGDYTVGEASEFAGVATYYSRNATAGVTLSNWTTPATWSTTGHGGVAAADFPVGVPVIIAAGHQVRGNANSLLAESVEHNAGAVLDLEDTFGHNFGVVTGTGKIRIKATASNQFVFPGGNYEVINGPGGGITEFYDNINGTLPTQTFYNVVRLIGSSTRTQSNIDITVYGNWLLESGVVSNADHNRTVTLFNDWLNTASASAYVPGTGRVVLAKTSGTQTIGGTFPTTFATLQTNGSANKVLSRSIVVNQSLQLTSGNLILNSDTLTLGTSATITGTPSVTAMLVTNSTGVVRKRFGVVGSFTIPVGDTTGTNEYSPVTLNLASGTLGGSASVDVRVTDAIPPFCGGSSYTSRFWNVAANDITAFSLGLTPRYLDADVIGTESELFSVTKIGSGDCVVGGAVNTTTNTATSTVSGSPILLTFGNAGFIPEPTVQVSALAVVAVTPTSIQLSWAAGNGTKRLVVIREGFAVSANPVDGVQYTADANFSGSPQFLGSGNYVVFAGSGTGVTITGLAMNTTYHFRVYEYNEVGINTNYLLTGAPTISRKTQITATVTVSGDRGWRAITSPARTLYSDLLGGFYTQGFTGTDYPDSIPNMLWYVESFAGTDNQRWRKPSSMADSVVAGRGYMFYVFGDMGISGYNNPANALPKAMSVTGFETPLTGGEFTYPVTFTPAADSGWNLVGNPLYSDINWDHASWTKTNMDNSIYVWSDSANTGLGDYLTWNGTTGSLGTGKISTMQAFWVKANAASPVLKLTEAARTTGATFYKESDTDTDTQARLDSIPILEFTLRHGGMTKKMHVMFSGNGRVGMDREDAWHLVSMNPSFLEFYSSSAEGNPLSIQHMPRKLYRTADIPISVGGYLNGKRVTGPYEIALTGAWNLPDKWELELYDRKTKRSIMLTPASRTTFSADADTSATLGMFHWLQDGGMRKTTATSEERFTLKVHPNGEFSDIPEVVTLSQNYPNPFNPSTTITYTVPEEMRVRLEVYDILGRRVATLVDQNQNAGRYKVQFDMRPYASGVYLYRIVTGESTLVKKMTLIK